MPLTQDDLWAALESIGAQDDGADKLAPPVIAKLIELRFVELTATTTINAASCESSGVVAEL